MSTKDANHIKRPMNAFMVWSREKRKVLSQENPRMHNSFISKILGSEWKKMDDESKQPFIQKAKELQAQHSRDNPGYKYKPRRRKPKQNMLKKAAYPFGPYTSPDGPQHAALKMAYPNALPSPEAVYQQYFQVPQPNYQVYDMSMHGPRQQHSYAGGPPHTSTVHELAYPVRGEFMQGGHLYGGPMDSPPPPTTSAFSSSQNIHVQQSQEHNSPSYPALFTQRHM